MTIICKVCKQMLTGPTAPPQVLAAADRAAFEFAAMYQTMGVHMHQHHGEVMPTIVGLIDSFALSVLANCFTASDETKYAELHENVKASSFVALSANWSFTIAKAPAAGRPIQ